MPALDRELADDHGGADLVAVVDDLQEILGLVAQSGRDQEVVEEQEPDLGELGEQARVAAVAACQTQVAEQTGGAHVERGMAAADGGVGEGTGDERLAAAGRPGDEQVVVGVDPAGLGQAEDDGAVEAAWGPEVDLLHADALAQLGRLQAQLEPPVITRLGLAVDEQAEPLLEAELQVLALLELLAHGLDHARQAHRLQLVEGLVDEHQTASFP